MARLTTTLFDYTSDYSDSLATKPKPRRTKARASAQKEAQPTPPKSRPARAQDAESQLRRQRPLKSIRSNSLLLQSFDELEISTKRERLQERDDAEHPVSSPVRKTPGRRAKKAVQCKAAILQTDREVDEAASSRIGSPCHLSEGDGYEESSGDEEDSLAVIDLWPQRQSMPQPWARESPTKEGDRYSSHLPRNERKSRAKRAIPALLPQGPSVIDLTSPSPKKTSKQFHPMSSLGFKLTHSRSGTFNSSDRDKAAILTLNPPKSRSPSREASKTTRPTTPPAVTPPQSPSKFRLKSPSKTKDRIPKAPFRPSIDAFWSAAVVNEWNDQYSPKKDALKSPRKKRFQELLSRDASSSSSSEVDVPSPSTSPRKQSPKKTSPIKTDPSVAKARKEFDAKKRERAEAFLKELDEALTGGKVAEMTASSGGVAIAWSKTLNKTAGRARWRRENARKPGEDGDKMPKHFASIELAEKVIDDEYKLHNTLAHEFCHLATFMISGVKDSPHGREFKEWGRKASKAFSSLEVKVTTKHDYEIDYKYVWECIGCGQEYKRHSKSIDPGKQTCGRCKSKLVQTKPAIRNAKVSDYQVFVKENYQEAKRNAKSAGHAAVMEVIGRMYRESKAAKGDGSAPEPAVKNANDVEDVVDALEVICLDD